MYFVQRLAALVLVSGCMFAQTTADSGLREGSISGVVWDASMAKPLAEVSLMLVGGSGRLNATTDANGAFKFSGLKPSDYRLVAGGSFGEVLGTKSIALKSGEDLTGVNLRVLLSGTISGRVIDENDEPIAGVHVFLVGTTYRTRGLLQYEPQAFAGTDAQGRYSLRGVRPGSSCFLVARKSPGRLEAQSSQPADPRERKPEPSDAWYPDFPSAERAVQVMLLSGEQRENVDIRSRRYPLRCVEGSTEAEGEPAALDFQLLDDLGILLSSGKTGPDGRFRFCGTGRSDFRILTFRQPTSGEAALVGSTVIPAGNEDISGLRIAAQSGLTLTGQVVWETGAPAEPITENLAVEFMPVNRRLLPFETGIRFKASLPGSFSADNLALEDYLVSVSGRPAGSYVKDMTYAGRSVLKTPLHLGTAVGNAELKIIIGRDAGSLTTTVRDQEGKPVSDVWVVVFSAEADSESALAKSMDANVTGPSGALTFGTLAPGKYLVIASSTWMDQGGDMLGRIWRARNKAKEIDVGPRATVDINLPPSDI